MPFTNSVGGLAPSRPSATALVLLLPVAYACYLNWTIRRTTTATTGRVGDGDSSATDIAEPQSLPDEVKANRENWVVIYERIMSNPIAKTALSLPMETSTTATRPSALLALWNRAAHKAFSWTPQAFIIRSLIKEPVIRRSFDADWIDELSFEPGDIVNGVYRVSHYGCSDTETLELVIEIPPSYKGPAVRGLIISGVEPATVSSPSNKNSDAVVFVNETWFWRRHDEPPTLLESSFGAWFHRMLGGWLITKGLAAVL